MGLFDSPEMIRQRLLDAEHEAMPKDPVERAGYLLGQGIGGYFTGGRKKPVEPELERATMMQSLLQQTASEGMSLDTDPARFLGSLSKKLMNRGMPNEAMEVFAKAQEFQNKQAEIENRLLATQAATAKEARATELHPLAVGKAQALQQSAQTAAEFARPIAEAKMADYMSKNERRIAMTAQGVRNGLPKSVARREASKANKILGKSSLGDIEVALQRLENSPNSETVANLAKIKWRDSKGKTIPEDSFPEGAEAILNLRTGGPTPENIAAVRAIVNRLKETALPGIDKRIYTTTPTKPIVPVASPEIDAQGIPIGAPMTGLIGGMQDIPKLQRSPISTKQADPRYQRLLELRKKYSR